MSSENKNGLWVTIKLARQLAKQIPQQHIAIISMYAHEVCAIRKELEDAGYVGFNVSTVDAFQGKEAGAVVVHCSAAVKGKSIPLASSRTCAVSTLL